MRQTHTQTDRQTQDKVMPMCRYALQVTQKQSTLYCFVCFIDAVRHSWEYFSHMCNGTKKWMRLKKALTYCGHSGQRRVGNFNVPLQSQTRDEPLTSGPSNSIGFILLSQYVCQVWWRCTKLLSLVFTRLFPYVLVNLTFDLQTQKGSSSQHTV